MNLIGIISARLDSSRLPGKMLMPLCGIPLLAFVVRRAKAIHRIGSLVLATTDRPVDDPLEAAAHAIGIGVYRGELEDVAGRFLRCAQEHDASYFVRINGDSPCLDASLIDEGLAHCETGYDLITNIVGRTFPEGISLEIVKVAALESIHALMSAADREHVTSFFYKNSDQFSIKAIRNQSLITTTLRFTIDEAEDFDRMTEFLKDNPNRSWRDAA